MTPVYTQPAPRLERVRHDLVKRELMVQQVDHITPHMIRITFTGESLDSFTSLSPDDHIKIFIPNTTTNELEMRDYTPRHFDKLTKQLVIDFAVHEGGPATTWALNARPGDTLSIGGPRGSQVIQGDIESWILIGDETALAAIGRRVEEQSKGTKITTIVAISDSADQQLFNTPANVSYHWWQRPLENATSAEGIIKTLSGLTIHPNTFIWVAAESSVVKAVRKFLVEETQVSTDWLKVSGYWKLGSADTHD